VAAELGPWSAQLAARTQRVSELVRQSLDQLVAEAAACGSLEATVLQLRLELERCRRKHEMEAAQLRRRLDEQDAERQVPTTTSTTTTV